jgi:hypothetical protein
MEHHHLPVQQKKTLSQGQSRYLPIRTDIASLIHCIKISISDQIAKWGRTIELVVVVKKYIFILSFEQ